VKFEVVGEDGGSNDGDEDATERAADGDHEIETRQVARVGSEAIKFAMTNHAADE